jgi:chemotaxis family two-component system response regulator PixG
MIPNYLIGEFKSCTQIQYNGSLNIKSSKGIIWKFYYRLGRIVWASGGIHPFRRWRRQMAQYVQKHLTHSQKDVLAVSESNLKLSYS